MNISACTRCLKSFRQLRSRTSLTRHEHEAESLAAVRMIHDKRLLHGPIWVAFVSLVDACKLECVQKHCVASHANTLCYTGLERYLEQAQQTHYRFVPAQPACSSSLIVRRRRMVRLKPKSDTFRVLFIRVCACIVMYVYMYENVYVNAYIIMLPTHWS